MTPYYQRENITLYVGKAEEIIPSLPSFDLLCLDPPYGISAAAADFIGTTKRRNAFAAPRDYGHDNWDDKPFDDATIAAMRSISTHQIIWGGNYYSLPPSSCWLVWDKENGASSFADCELAWTNFPKAVRIVRHQWQGMLRKGNEPRYHPTQKPLAVIEWAIQQAPAGVHSVADFCMGSGTTGVACVRLGKSFTGIDRVEKYVEIAAKRIDTELNKGRLFTPQELNESTQLPLPAGVE